MGERYWVWVIVRLAVGVAIVAWAASYLTAGGGEKEFQKTLDAMKQVHSFRVAFTSTATPGTQHNEMLWEVDCNRNLLHYQWHMTDTADAAKGMTRDEVHLATQEFDRQSDGSWSKPRYAGGRPASWYCGALAQGNDNNLMPQIATMIRRGILQKGDKKTVNGVRCREWQVTLKGGTAGLEHDTVCLGLEDHLPYEMTVDWQNSRSLFSDYNAPISFDVPEGVLQPASASAGAN
jgi:hypothetical protein